MLLRLTLAFALTGVLNACLISNADRECCIIGGGSCGNLDCSCTDFLDPNEGICTIPGCSIYLVQNYCEKCYTGPPAPTTTTPAPTTTIPFLCRFGSVYCDWPGYVCCSMPLCVSTAYCLAQPPPPTVAPPATTTLTPTTTTTTTTTTTPTTTTTTTTTPTTTTTTTTTPTTTTTTTTTTTPTTTTTTTTTTTPTTTTTTTTTPTTTTTTTTTTTPTTTTTTPTTTTTTTTTTTPTTTTTTPTTTTTTTTTTTPTTTTTTTTTTTPTTTTTTTTTPTTTTTTTTTPTTTTTTTTTTTPTTTTTTTLAPRCEYNDYLTSTRLLGGTQATDCTQAPGFVSIKISFPFDTTVLPFCGGVLINQNQILTSTFCAEQIGLLDGSPATATVFDFNDNPISTISNLTPEGETFTLDSPVTFSGADCLLPACIVTDTSLLNLADCTVYAAGISSSTGLTEEGVKSDPISITGVCDDGTLWCTDGTGTAEACAGDAGSPLICPDAAGQFVVAAFVNQDVGAGSQQCFGTPKFDPILPLP